MNKKEIIEVLNSCGAHLNGHFLLTSGLHSNEYYQLAKVFKATDTRCPDMLVKALCTNMLLHLSGRPDVVIAPAVGGVNICYAVGRYLKVPNIYTERVDGKMVLKRGFEIEPGKTYSVVEDVTTTGGSVNETIELVQNEGGEVVSVSCLVDRSNGKINFGDIIHLALLRIDVNKWKQEDCPLCAEGKRLVKLGSREIK